jgi:hypothetical protein
MSTLTVRQTENLVHKTNLALTLAMVLGTIEILRRTPRWLLLLGALLLYTVVYFAVIHIWWIVAALAALVGWKLLVGAARGWREAP